MFDYKKHFTSSISSLKQENRYRVFRELRRRQGEFPKADLYNVGPKREITVWCSNDYLGMGQHPSVLKAMEEALYTFGAGAGGTRNISGTHKLIVELEAELAELHNKEGALVFSSGYVANETTLSTLASILPNCLVISDSHNHASMIDGIRHSRAEKIIFQHNDIDHLKSILQSADPSRPKLVAFESLYSMDGDFSPMKEIIQIAKRYGAFTYVDETHAVGVYGLRGGGVAEREGLLSELDVIQGGLGKGFGVVGGFVSANKVIIDTIRSYGAGFIFTTALPPTVAAGALASIRHLKESQTEREMLFDRVRKVKEVLSREELPIQITTSHIVPFMIGDAAVCKEMSDMLLSEFDVYVQPINYPTVPRGTERLRITPSPLHTDTMIEHLAKGLSLTLKDLKLELVA